MDSRKRIGEDVLDTQYFNRIVEVRNDLTLSEEGKVQRLISILSEKTGIELLKQVYNIIRVFINTTLISKIIQNVVLPIFDYLNIPQVEDASRITLDILQLISNPEVEISEELRVKIIEKISALNS